MWRSGARAANTAIVAKASVTRMTKSYRRLAARGELFSDLESNLVHIDQGSCGNRLQKWLLVMCFDAARKLGAEARLDVRLESHFFKGTHVSRA